MGCRISIGNFVPVDDIPERTDVVGASILVIQVIGMFPDIETKNGRQSLRERVILIGRRTDMQSALIVN